ncbi:hypothetical protein PoB_005910300 [Plakobranchus ocellatus]|uniref:Uncharacterized protein n=1 Tax=Plakobranchus ocellatus TaxID=259542 RepID=A0AAV4CLF9_9GAST|nr:hypothetical protein PoB_005910300 [Plakobranchus ocellatus]
MELRNRKIIHPPRDYFTANGADQYNLYTPLKRPVRLRRELRGLGLLKNRDLITCTPAVREKLEETERIRNTARLQIQEGQRREREAELNARRFGRPHTPDRFNEYERQQIQRYDIRVIPAIDPEKLQEDLDTFSNQLMVDRDGLISDARDRQEGRKCVVLDRCNLCRMFRYPERTELLPYQWSISCHRVKLWGRALGETLSSLQVDMIRNQTSITFVRTAIRY